jgi:hypothetical protein
MGPREARDFAAAIAELLDRRFHVPGTRIRIGLDPILGLVPGIGDAIANAIGSFIVFVAVQQGVPRITLARMSLNIAINALVGAIPVAGDVFSVWWKSNVKNLELLDRHLSRGPAVSTAPDWGFVAALVVGGALIAIGTLGVTIWLVKTLWYAIPAGG